MPEVTVTQIGLAVVILMILGKFIFEWRRDRREEAERIEPKHSPSIDHKIEARVSSAETKLYSDLNAVRAESKQETDKLHGRISQFRNEIRGDLDKSAKKVEDAMTEVRSMFHETTKVISKQEGQLEQMNQHLVQTERKIDNHIATDSKT